MIITSHEQFVVEISEQAANSKQVYIASFGLYAGINVDGSVLPYDNSVGRLLDALTIIAESVEINILVGRPMLIECVKGCEHCKEKYDNWLIRFGHHKNNWPKFNWHLSNMSHAKFVVFEPHGICMIGGMNLSDSGLFDIDYMLANRELANHLVKEFERLASDNSKLMPFGKYRNQAFSSIPTSYLKWIVSQIDMPDDVLEEAKIQLEKNE